MKLKKESFLLKVVGYIFIMAIANAAILHIFHYRYQDIGFGHLLFFFEVILSFYALWVYKKETPIVRLKDFRITPWFIPSLLVMGAILIIHLLANPFAKDAMTILKLMMTTILVGFSEEVLFRGFMLNNLIKRYSAIKAILISSVAFSLLHAVNILGGEPFYAVSGQLVNTFIAGLFFAAIYLQGRSLIPLIIYHFLYDYLLLVNSLVNAPIMKLVEVEFILRLVMMLPLLWFTHQAFKKPDSQGNKYFSSENKY